MSAGLYPTEREGVHKSLSNRSLFMMPMDIFLFVSVDEERQQSNSLLVASIALPMLFQFYW